MTKQERDELAKLARRRERTAKTGVDHRVAEVMADVEAQLAATYRADDEAWAEITRAASEAVADADAAVAARCAEMGIRPEFRPKLTVGWYARGENGVNTRRAELRAAAKARLDHEAKRARHEIALRTDDVLTELTAGALHSDAAKAFLQSIPTPTALLPTFDVAQLEGGPR